METIEGLVSIIIPVYNRQHVIEECIQSVLAQTYQNFEIIIVDDGSTDSTLDICKKIAEKEPRIRLLTGEHKGVSAARNMALSAATGEYLFFLDSDDVIHPLLLENLIINMETTGAQLGGVGIYKIPDQRWDLVKQLIAEDTEIGDVVFQPHEEALNALFTGNSPLGTMPGTIMRSTLVGSTKFNTTLHIGEDFYFNYENLIKGASCISLPNKWYYLRIHQHNSSWDYTFDGFWSRFHRRELVWKNEILLGRHKYADLQKADAFSCYLRCAARNRIFNAECKKMRAVLRKYSKEMLPAFDFKRKCYYILTAYFPAFTVILNKLINRKK